MSSSPANTAKSDPRINRIIRIAAITYFLFVTIFIFLNDLQSTQHFFLIFATVPYLDKIGHFILMGFFSFIVNLALNGRNFKIFNFRYLLGSIIVFGFATIEEILQLFVSGRNFEFLDMISNTIGIILFGEFARILLIIARVSKTRIRQISKISDS